MRELPEMRERWQQPLRLDDSGLLAVLGSEPHTPRDAAIERTLAALGLLPHGYAIPSFRYL